MPHDWIVEIIGAMTVVSSLLVKIIGLPSQILTNHSRKSTDGVSTLNHAIGLLSYACWTTYGVLTADRVIVYGQFLGVVTEAIIVVQIAAYRRRRR